MVGEGTVGDYTNVVLFLATLSKPDASISSGRPIVVPETIEASLWLSEALLSRIGMPPDAVAASIRQRRDEFRHQAANANTANRQGRRASHR